MWKTFGGGASGGGGMGSGGGGGGGSGGGGRIIRTVHRAIRTGGSGGSGNGNGGTASNPAGNTTTSNSSTTTTTTTTKPNNSKSNNQFSLSSSSSSSPFSLLNIPVCVAATAPYWAPCTCINCNGEFDWECVDGVEDERTNGYFDDPVFGEVPSAEEVEQAVCSLQQVIDPTSFSQYIRDKNVYLSENDEIDMISSPTGSQKAGSELDWMEPSLQGYVSRTFHSPGPARVYDAFHLLQADPSVKRMVVSLSSDKAVWEAVLNNEVVRELRDSLSKGSDKSVSGGSDKAVEDSNAAADIMSWIFVNTKTKVMELVDKITKLVNDLFHPPVEEKPTNGEEAEDNFQKAVKSSLMLSVLVLLIVVVGRVRQA